MDRDVLVLMSIFFLEGQITDHQWMWPSQGLQNERIISNSLTSQLAYRD